MDVDLRPADEGDFDLLREIAEQSFQTSYSLSPEQIEIVVEAQLSDERLSERTGDGGDALVIVAVGTAEDEDDTLDGPVGFVDVSLEDAAVIEWLHVEPGARGQGVGTLLVERVREEAGDRPLASRVLEEASEGGTFCEQFGLGVSGTDRLEVEGEEYPLEVYTEGGPPQEANEPTVEVPDTVTVDGAELYLDRDDEVAGTEAPFFHLYEDEAGEERWGFFCSNCGSTEVMADNLDRLECSDCGNQHRAEDWDAGYL